ncbi:BT_3928 family protein [Agriterribacter sp.]|uniref:BT_3928 family protein n=1 Tax=Agriterribacter sp. TaxID=2821509 RepID=UPI002D08F45D|nr:BT_3928 family protein [Agriterribacter sp.]HTN08978.1 BT_3928 family protein [Agriterribacter sp.]
MKSIITISRYIVGILFIFSGLVKANDPLGLAYKMQEFFEVWAQSGWLPNFMHAMNDYALAFSVIMIAFEIVAGVAVLVGWKMRLFSWLLLILIIFFTFLTGYAYLSGKFRSCGCFGDCIPITPKTSFIKDIVLLLLILFIFRWRNTIKPALPAFGSICIILLSVTFSIWLQWYVLKHLPVADCLPFKEGNNIPEKMKIPPNAIPDSTVISFVYEKDGATVEFTSDNFPDDFDDSVYHFIKRYDKLIRKGNAEPAIKDFVLTTLSGNDTTMQVLSDAGYSAFLFVKDDPGKGEWMKNFESLYPVLQQQKITLFVVTNNAESINSYFSTAPAVTFLKCDVVPIKTAARTNPALYLLQNGTIRNKWSYADWDNAREEIQAIVN